MSIYSLLEGRVDHLGQALVQVELLFESSRAGSVLAAIDTAFNRGLWFTVTHAQEAGIEIPERRDQVVFPDGLLHPASLTSLNILWFGYPQRVDAYISTTPYLRRSGEELVALLGTELLQGTNLLIDYRSGRVRLER